MEQYIKEYDLFLFDFDGTLADTEALHHREYERVFLHHCRAMGAGADLKSFDVDTSYGKKASPQTRAIGVCAAVLVKTAVPIVCARQMPYVLMPCTVAGCPQQPSHCQVSVKQCHFILLRGSRKARARRRWRASWRTWSMAWCPSRASRCALCNQISPKAQTLIPGAPRC